MIFIKCRKIQININKVWEDIYHQKYKLILEVLICLHPYLKGGGGGIYFYLWKWVMYFSTLIWGIDFINGDSQKLYDMMFKALFAFLVLTIAVIYCFLQKNGALSEKTHIRWRRYLARTVIKTTKIVNIHKLFIYASRLCAATFMIKIIKTMGGYFSWESLHPLGIGLMHEENILGNTPNNTHLIFKNGNSHHENQYFSTFQIPLEPCWQRWG